MNFKRFFQIVGLSAGLAASTFTFSAGCARQSFDSDWKPAEVERRLAFWEADKQFGSPWDEEMEVLHLAAKASHDNKGKPLDITHESNVRKSLVGLQFRLDEAARAYQHRVQQLAGKEAKEFSDEEIKTRRDAAKIIIDNMSALVDDYLREINANSGSNYVNPLKK